MHRAAIIGERLNRCSLRAGAFAADADTAAVKAFVAAFRYIRNRLAVFTALPVASLDKAALGTKLREIGRLEGGTQPRPDVA